MKNIINGNRLINEHNQFLQEQLMDAQQSLFFARSVKEAKFLQTRINYLKGTLKSISSVNKNGKRTNGRKIKG